MADETRQDQGDVDASSHSLVDWDAALELAAGDPELLLEMLDAMQIELPQRIKDLRVSLQAEDDKSLQRSAHSIKNLCHNIGAMQSYEVAFQLEIAARDGDRVQYQPLTTQLLPMIEDVQHEVDRFVNSKRG